MTTASIASLRTERDNLRNALKKTKKSNFSDNRYGTEQEYTYRGMLGGVEAILADVALLVKSPAEFCKISTVQERGQLVTHLQNIRNHLSVPQSLHPHLDEAKKLLRNYCLRTRDDWFQELGSAVAATIKLKQELEDNVEASKKLREDIANLKEDVESSSAEFNNNKQTVEKSFVERETEWDKQIATHEEKIEQYEAREAELGDLVTTLEKANIQSEELLEEISNSATSAKSNEKLINSFAQKIQEREKSFDALVAKTDDNTKELALFQEERAKYLIQAESLIESAKKALKYKTAEGLSAAFTTEKKSNEGIRLYGWLIGAGLAAIIALSIGIWILVKPGGDFNIILGRLALMPIPLAFSWFCAGQYVKVKNILTDYGYKTTLAKSLVGFSEHLTKNGSESKEEYRDYLKTMLTEIHQDPLRSRKLKDSKGGLLTEQEQSLEVVSKILEIVKNAKTT